MTKPSERIFNDWDVMARRHFGSCIDSLNKSEKIEAQKLALLHYLNEEAERRAAFEADVLERLAKLERKTSGVSDGGMYR